MTHHSDLKICAGDWTRLGANFDGDGVNFAINPHDGEVVFTLPEDVIEGWIVELSSAEPAQERDRL